MSQNYLFLQIFFGAINCWWPEGECRKYQNIRRYPLLVAHIRTEGEIEYNGPILASYIIPFLENVMNPVMPIQNEGELLDLRAKHDVSLKPLLPSFSLLTRQLFLLSRPFFWVTLILWNLLINRAIMRI